KVILTHGHPDHLWGLIDEFEEAPRFPKAQYVMAGTEWDFWSGDQAMSKLPEMFQGFAIGAKKHLLPVAEKVTRVKPGAEVAPGITLLGTPGHTPGHVSVMVSSAGKSLLVTADTMTHPYISFEHPEWRPGTDLDGETAEQSRRQMLDMGATDKPLALVYHVSFPGLGHVARAGNAYRWVPATWKWDL
ncbi:MAG: MBL fold metallo-hydrolase, partial [Pseudomonadota bacterium]|nr:MBL fold metallo-hydrolase [Pseudomonadota bacterium]